MKQLDLDTDRLRNNLRAVVDNVEQALHHMSDVTGDKVVAFRSRAGRRMGDAQDRLVDIEHHTAAQLRRIGRQTQVYVHDHPWQLVGALAIATAALAMVARTRLF